MQFTEHVAAVLSKMRSNDVEIFRNVFIVAQMFCDDLDVENIIPKVSPDVIKNASRNINSIYFHMN